MSDIVSAQVIKCSNEHARRVADAWATLTLKFVIHVDECAIVIA